MSKAVFPEEENARNLWPMRTRLSHAPLLILLISNFNCTASKCPEHKLSCQLKSCKCYLRCSLIRPLLTWPQKQNQHWINSPASVFISFKPYEFFSPLTAEWALRALIDFILSNARRFYSSMGNPFAGKGLDTYSVIFSYTIWEPFSLRPFWTLKMKHPKNTPRLMKDSLINAILFLIFSCNQFTQKGDERVLFLLVNGHIGSGD